MGREQGDELPKEPTVYVGDVDGERVERPAYSPADEVNLRARGWVRKTSQGQGGKRGGRPRPAPATDPAPAAAADTASSSG